jgi:hypothetical protein
VVFDFQNYFNGVAQSIYDNWDRTADDHLAGAATYALEKCLTAGRPDAAECLLWAVTTDTLPIQGWDFDFGQPAITVVRTEDFRIDLLYWLENAAATHDHMTCGAFAAFYGPRLHGVYDFEESVRHDENVSSGTLSRRTLEFMDESQVRPISPELIHDVYWLSKPTVTLVIRCNDHPGPQRTPREYWEPGLSFVNRTQLETSLVGRRVEGLDLLSLADEQLYSNALTGILAGGEPSLLCQAFLHAAVKNPQLLDARLASAPGGPLLDRLKEGRRPILRRSVFAGTYPDHEDAQLVAGLLWAQADRTEAQSVLAAARPSRDRADVVSNGLAGLADLDDLLHQQAAPATAGWL